MTTKTKFEVGKWYKRGDGELIRVVCVDAPGEYPVIGVCESGATARFTSAGQFFTDRHWIDRDLIPTPVEPKKKGVVWVNVYEDGSAVSFHGKETALFCHKDLIARIRVNWEEGRFDD